MMINLGVFTCNIESLGFFILCNAEQIVLWIKVRFSITKCKLQNDIWYIYLLFG